MSSASAPNVPALLVIDVQKAIDHPSWGRRNNPDAERRMGELLAHWRQRGWPIVHIRHASREPSSTYRPDGDGFEFKAEVVPESGETIVTKRANNAFIETDLDALLKARSIGSLVLCGVITNNSVEATARMAGNLGYLTYVVSDATATFDKIDLDGVPRRAEEMHAIALANLHGEYAHIVTTARVLGGLETRAPLACKTLADVRDHIDRTDRAIVALLAQRARLVREAARFKHSAAAVRAPERVEQVVANAKDAAIDFGADPALVEALYRAMIAKLIEIELREHSSMSAIRPPQSEEG
jgi:chorismate mutase-like protein